MSTPPSRPILRPGADDAEYLARLVGLAGQVTESLPADSPSSWRATTYRSVLSAIVRDHIDNGTGNLQDGDVASLSEFVVEAAEAASSAPEQFRDDAYEVVLQALLEDWVDNWDGSDLDDDD